MSFLPLFFLGCGPAESEVAEDDAADEPSKVTVIAAAPSTQKLLSIPTSIENASASETSFSLSTPADDYEIQLSGCLSGYTATVTTADTDGLKAYRYDKECLAKLTEFTYLGDVYVPTVADPFTTWQVGDTAWFDEVGEPGISPLMVIVLSTLGDPVTGTDVVSYGFSEVAAGQDREILWTTVGASAQIEVAANAEPSFTIRSIEFLGLSATEAGRYKFVLECTSNIGITNICETIDFADLDYALVEDTYAGAPTNVDGDLIFASAGTGITLPADRVAPGDQGTANGGFVTVELDGPDDLALHPHMIFMIRSYAASFQYFNVDVTVSASY